MKVIRGCISKKSFIPCSNRTVPGAAVSSASDKFTVYIELYLITVGIADYLLITSFLSLKIPVRSQMQCNFLCIPDRTEVVIGRIPDWDNGESAEEMSQKRSYFHRMKYRFFKEGH